MVEKAACCSDKVSSLENSLSELDNKVLGALAVSSGELSTKLAGFQELHQQLLADSQVVFVPNCKVAVLNLNVWLKVSWFQTFKSCFDCSVGDLWASFVPLVVLLLGFCALIVCSCLIMLTVLNLLKKVMDNWLNRRFGA